MPEPRNRCIKFSLYGLLIIFSIMIISLFYSAWVEWVKNQPQKSYIAKLDDVSYSSYLKIEMYRLQADEPIVEAKVLIYTEDPEHVPRIPVTIAISGDRGYLGSKTIKLWHPFGNGYISDTWENAPLFPSKGSHAWFPFDNLKFNSVIFIEPALELAEVELVNRVRGFTIISQPTLERNGEAILLKFRLNRNMFIQVLFAILAVASILFMIFILRLKTTEELAISVASYFITLWSIRGAISYGLETFPSLLDFWTLGLFVIFLICILFKIIYEKLFRIS